MKYLCNWVCFSCVNGFLYYFQCLFTTGKTGMNFFAYMCVQVFCVKRCWLPLGSILRCKNTNRICQGMPWVSLKITQKCEIKLVEVPHLLVVQWFRIHLPMQGTRSLVQGRCHILQSSATCNCSSPHTYSHAHKWSHCNEASALQQGVAPTHATRGSSVTMKTQSIKNKQNFLK